MNAKQNLEVLDPFETLIITNPNCHDTIIIGIKRRKLIVRNFCNENVTDKTLDNYLEKLPAIQRDIEFTGKIYILADQGLDKPLLFSIEENERGLILKSVKRKELEQNENLLNR